MLNLLELEQLNNDKPYHLDRVKEWIGAALTLAPFLGGAVFTRADGKYQMGLNSNGDRSNTVGRIRMKLSRWIAHYLSGPVVTLLNSPGWQ